jgi:hypothetical protein
MSTLTGSNKPSSIILSILIIVAIHTPYIHLHFLNGSTHNPGYEHHSESDYHDPISHERNSNTGLLAEKTFEFTREGVEQHLHFVREFCGTRTNRTNKADDHRNPTYHNAGISMAYKHELTDTPPFFHTIKISPLSSKAFSGLSPPAS